VVITMLFSGGMIPWYITISKLNLLGSIWALVLPPAVPVFNVLVLMNFFRELPPELEEAAIIDGAGQWQTMMRIFLPLSVPSLATLTVFVTVAHWNSWFDGLILMSRAEQYPLQSYLQTIVIQRSNTFLSLSDIKRLKLVNERTSKSAQIFIGMLPILMVYPFFQKYFTKGLILGSVKG